MELCKLKKKKKKKLETNVAIVYFQLIVHVHTPVNFRMQYMIYYKICTDVYKNEKKGENDGKNGRRTSLQFKIKTTQIAHE